MKLSEQCIEAINNQCGYFDNSNCMIFKDGAINALTNPSIYEKAGLISLEDALGFNEWCAKNKWILLRYTLSLWANKLYNGNHTTAQLYEIYQQQKKK